MFYLVQYRSPSYSLQCFLSSHHLTTKTMPHNLEFFLDFIFLKQFQIHDKIKWKVWRFLLYPLPPHRTSCYRLSTSPTRMGYLLQLMNFHCFFMIFFFFTLAPHFCTNFQNSQDKARFHCSNKQLPTLRSLKQCMFISHSCYSNLEAR